MLLRVSSCSTTLKKHGTSGIWIGMLILPAMSRWTNTIRSRGRPWRRRQFNSKPRTTEVTPSGERAHPSSLNRGGNSQNRGECSNIKTDEIFICRFKWDGKLNINMSEVIAIAMRLRKQWLSVRNVEEWWETSGGIVVKFVTYSEPCELGKEERSKISYPKGPSTGWLEMGQSEQPSTLLYNSLGQLFTYLMSP